MIAYAGPVSRPEIARVRGVSADGAVAGLLERGLIEEAGRGDTRGAPVLYRTTVASSGSSRWRTASRSLPALDALTPEEAHPRQLRDACTRSPPSASSARPARPWPTRPLYAPRIGGARRPGGCGYRSARAAARRSGRARCGTVAPVVEQVLQRQQRQGGAGPRSSVTCRPARRRPAPRPAGTGRDAGRPEPADEVVVVHACRSVAHGMRGDVTSNDTGATSRSPTATRRSRAPRSSGSRRTCRCQRPAELGLPPRVVGRAVRVDAWSGPPWCRLLPTPSPSRPSTVTATRPAGLLVDRGAAAGGGSLTLTETTCISSRRRRRWCADRSSRAAS